MRSLVLPPKCINLLKRFIKQREIRFSLQDSKRPKGLRLFDFFPNKAHLDALLSRFILPCIHSFTHTPFEALLEAESVSNRVFPLVLVGFIQQLIIREFVHDGFVDAVERKSSVGTRLDRQHDHGGV